MANVPLVDHFPLKHGGVAQVFHGFSYHPTSMIIPTAAGHTGKLTFHWLMLDPSGKNASSSVEIIVFQLNGQK